jgi:hypothetical protein
MTHVAQDVYLISEADLADPARAAMALNLILHQISDRLDQLEGGRGVSTIEAPIDVVDNDGNIVGGFTNVSSR